MNAAPPIARLRRVPADCLDAFAAYRSGSLDCQLDRLTNAQLEEPDLSFKLEPTWPDSIPPRPPKQHVRLAYQP